MIELRDITKIYMTGEEKLYALNHINLSIAAKEYVCVIGPSGSGKSTLMNIIGCLDTPTEGEYILDGTEIRQYSEDQLAEIRSTKIGFVFQSFNLIPKLTAAENVELPLIYQNISRGERKERVHEALAKVGLEDRANHSPAELSGGQQQRIAIARALVTKPSLILADEATGNLDSKTTGDILELFRQIHEQGNTIVFITHNDEIAGQAPRRVRILDGRLTEG